MGSKKTFTKLSQLPPLGGMLPPMPPAVPQQGNVQPKDDEDINQPRIVLGPLDTPEKILVDAGIKKLLISPRKIDEIISKIWEDYGGLPNGKAKSFAIGERVPQDAKRKILDVKKERELNEERKWERLPKGKTITEITSKEEIGEFLKQMSLSVVKEIGSGGAQGGAPGGAPGGGMGGLFGGLGDGGGAPPMPPPDMGGVGGIGEMASSKIDMIKKAEKIREIFLSEDEIDFAEDLSIIINDLKS